MGGREGVVDIDVAERGERRRETGIVGLLAGMEAEVFQQQHLARAETGRRLLGERADAVFREAHAPPAERPAERPDERAERQGGHALSARPAEMRQQDHRAAFGADLLDRGREAVETRGVGDPRRPSWGR